jgi:hypothetical protein
MDYTRIPFMSQLNNGVARGMAGASGSSKSIVLRPLKGAAPGWPGFFDWLRKAHPELTAKVVGSVEGMGADDPVAATAAAAAAAPESFGAKLADVIKSAGAAILPLVQQQKILSIQVDRAKKGLPPLDASLYESSTQGMNFGINKSTQTTILLLGGGLLLVMVLPKLLGGSRRGR